MPAYSSGTDRYLLSANQIICGNKLLPPGQAQASRPFRVDQTAGHLLQARQADERRSLSTSFTTNGKQ